MWRRCVAAVVASAGTTPCCLTNIPFRGAVLSVENVVEFALLALRFQAHQVCVLAC